MQRTRAFVVAAASTLIVLASACGDDGGGTDADGLFREGVALVRDGDDVALAEVCVDTDGAVVAVDEEGALVKLDHAPRLVLRISTEGENFAETSQVDRRDLDGAVRYSGVVATGGKRVDVEVTVEDGADDDLERC